jgi:hypothetical protein
MGPSLICARLASLHDFCGALGRVDIKQYHVSECGHAENALLDFIVTRHDHIEPEAASLFLSRRFF